jgi:Kef-type K+ transport system membrane component KefB
VNAPLALLLAVAAGYLAAHVVFDRLAKRFMIVSGAEYLLLGILLGPRVSKLLSSDVIDSLAPILTLALGWIGTIIGTQFELRRLITVPARRFRIGFAESACTLLIVAGLEFAVFRWYFLASVPDALVTAVAMGCMAVASSGVAIALLGESPDADKTLIGQLQLSTSINALVAIAGFGLLLSIHHLPNAGPRPLTATEWAVISIVIGVVGGALFHVFIGDTPESDRLFVALAGGIVLVSGASTYLGLSPLLSALFFGITLVNTTSAPAELIATLNRVERPFYFVLLLFGGAAWTPSNRSWAAPVALYVAARALGKIGGSRLAARMNGALSEFGDHWGRALLGQGRVALAIGLSYLRQEELPFRNVVFTATVASILLSEFFSARTAQSVLRRQVVGRASEALPETIGGSDPVPSTELTVPNGVR